MVRIRKFARTLTVHTSYGKICLRSVNSKTKEMYGMNTDLLTMANVVRFISLKGGNLLESADLGDLLRGRAKGLTGGRDVSARVLRDDYAEGFNTARGSAGHSPTKVPTDQLVEEAKQSHPDATGQQLREHFMAMGVVNGIEAANPRLLEYAKLVILYSLDISFGDMLELIATGPLPL